MLVSRRQRGLEWGPTDVTSNQLSISGLHEVKNCSHVLALSIKYVTLLFVVYVSKSLTFCCTVLISVLGKLSILTLTVTLWGKFQIAISPTRKLRHREEANNLYKVTPGVCGWTNSGLPDSKVWALSHSAMISSLAQRNMNYHDTLLVD